MKAKRNELSVSEKLFQIFCRLISQICKWPNHSSVSCVGRIRQVFGCIAGNPRHSVTCKVTFIGYRYASIFVIYSQQHTYEYTSPVLQIDNQLNEATFPVVLHPNLQKTFVNYAGSRRLKHCLEFSYLKQRKLRSTIYKYVRTSNRLLTGIFHNFKILYILPEEYVSSSGSSIWI